MLRKEKRAIGMVWVFRWSQVVNGRRHQPKIVIGTTTQFPTEAAANREVDRLRVRLNEDSQSSSLKPITFGQLINHYLDHELPRLSKSARIGNKSYVKNWIEPAWHGHIACSMKTMQIQEWLDKIRRPDGTKLKIKNVLSTIFSHGVRWELVQRNPVCGQGGTPGHRGASTGVRQSNRVSIKRVVLAAGVVRDTLEQLPLREATMALLDAVTALRASELIALKWKNVGWDTGILHSEFALVEGELKETKSRSNPLPLAQPVLDVLRLWREHTPYRSDEDWIFASPHYRGKTPYTYQILFRRHVRPVIERVSGLKSSKAAPLGWHTLRRSLATLLISNGENVKVTQSQLRHTTPKITLELYAQAVSTDQQKAHRKIVRMVLPSKFPEKLKTRSAAATAQVY
jgi:integrase